MSRSSKKGPFVEERLLGRIEAMNRSGEKRMRAAAEQEPASAPAEPEAPVAGSSAGVDPQAEEEPPQAVAEESGGEEPEAAEAPAAEEPEPAEAPAGEEPAAAQEAKPPAR